MPLSKLSVACRCMSADIQPEVSTSWVMLALTICTPPAPIMKSCSKMPYSGPREARKR